MRYHWGLGVGHVHAHQHSATSGLIPQGDTQEMALPEREAEERLDQNIANTHSETQAEHESSDVEHSDNPELGMEDRHLEGWEDDESEDSESDEGRDEDMEE
jgi:hypothetical protein